MGEDLINSTVSLTMKALDIIARLLQMLSNAARNSQGGNVTSSDMTDIKSGAIQMSSLEKHCLRTGNQICSSDQSVTKEDMKQIAKKAKAYGIPVAFRGAKNKDNIYPCVRKSDLNIFKNICTEVMQDKLAERPQELGNFKVQEWEIPYITAELNKHDLSAQFGKTKDGEYFCLFEKTDEKAIKIARQEFVRKCDEIEKDISIQKEENGFYTISDKRSGREITFDTLPTKMQLAQSVQTEFGYDANKADIVSAKFGQEQLKGDERKQFFSDNPQKEFSKIDSNIEMNGESILVKPYACWRLTQKTDNAPKLIFQNEDGAFCVLHPEVMTKKAMAESIRTSLHVQDDATVNALVDKAVGVTDYYQKQNAKNLTCQREFAMDQDENGNYTLKDLKSGIEKPTGTKAITTEIQRTGETSFSVTGKDIPKLDLSLSNKKTALQTLKEMYCEIGISEATAMSMAKEVFHKAELQSAVQVLSMEELKLKQTTSPEMQSETLLTVRYGNRTHEFDITDRKQAVNDISEYFELPEACALQVLEKAEEQIQTQKNHTVRESGEDNNVYYNSNIKPIQDSNMPESKVDLQKTTTGEMHPQNNLRTPDIPAPRR